MKCIICEKRPARHAKPYCAICLAQIKADEQRSQKTQPRIYLTYQGNVVGLFPKGGGTLRPEPLQRDPDSLPLSRTINLDRYCPGYTREQIKRFKATVCKCWSPLVKTKNNREAKAG